MSGDLVVPLADELHVELLAQMLAYPPVRAAALVDPARVGGYFTGQPLRWEAITVAEVAAIVRTVVPDCLDLHTAMLEHGLADLIEDDGVHPTIAGQRFILERVVAHLTMAGRR
ncbi:hypothetical protein DMB66_16695 [Actinoplanes sp. ATCC 53533]|uniref:SGNH/GDSL hydrolase family protein n=1 Tax=Actinoplanes sp. ATCC 53533 TaxID=1288362 RepID=UPI000F7861ED|nr:SGNH/GDSL hydrolase family protein [Actinoplanes sp. ATCC 53533]RSM65480.1 hypothetical protein DMB66_16695 [Actinoplanes sp. ATCC 53533]